MFKLLSINRLFELVLILAAILFITNNYKKLKIEKLEGKENINRKKLIFSIIIVAMLFPITTKNYFTIVNDGKTFAGLQKWEIIHFVLHIIGGIILPNENISVLGISVLYESLEYIFGNYYLKKEKGIEFWTNNKKGFGFALKDITVNLFGYAIGTKLNNHYNDDLNKLEKFITLGFVILILFTMIL
jgi:hypothetical protein